MWNRRISCYVCGIEADSSNSEQMVDFFGKPGTAHPVCRNGIKDTKQSCCFVRESFSCLLQIISCQVTAGDSGVFCRLDVCNTLTDMSSYYAWTVACWFGFLCIFACFFLLNWDQFFTGLVSTHIFFWFLRVQLPVTVYLIVWKDSPPQWPHLTLLVTVNCCIYTVSYTHLTLPTKRIV